MVLHTHGTIQNCTKTAKKLGILNFEFSHFFGRTQVAKRPVNIRQKTPNVLEIG